MTTNRKIAEILKTTDRFGGVYFYDELDYINELDNKVIVLNYVTRQEAIYGKVGHYVVIDNRIGLEKGQDNWQGCYYFGPYGIYPDKARHYLNLPNTGNVERFLNRIAPSGWKVNTTDFQVKQPWDDLCGIWAMIYVRGPNFRTNPYFNKGINRTDLDQELKSIFTQLKVLGNGYFDKINKARQLISI